MTTTPSTGREEAHAATAREIARPLAGVRRGARRLLVVRETAWIVAAFCGAVLALALIDYLLRLPWGLRLGFWAVGLAVLGVEAWKRLWPALRFNPPLSEIALRVERTKPARAAGLSGVLAAGLELSSSADRESEDSLRDRVGADAVTRLKLLSPGRATLLKAPARRALLLAALALAPLAAVTAWKPDLAEIGFRRVIMPWTGASWPKRTAVADATGLRAHPIGSAMPLRAVLARTDRPPGKTDVWAMYRLIGPGRDGTVRRALLTGQGRTGAVPGDPSTRGEVYERLIEPTGLGEPGQSRDAAPASGAELEYWFETADDSTAAVRVALVEPPVVERASAVVEPPLYAGTGGDFVSGTRDLGNGRDERASFGPVLAGSRISLRMTLNKPVHPPSNLSAAFPGADLPPGADISVEGREWTLAWDAAAPLRLPVMLVDEHGIRTDRDAAFQVGVIADRPPAAAVIEPGSDESVLATAVLDAVGEGRDDVGLAWATMDMQVARAPSGSEGAPAEAAGPVETVARVEPPGTAERELRVSVELDLSTLSLKPRDEVWLTTLAKDTFVRGDESHGPVRSGVRRLRVIAESELIEQVRAELAGVRQAALRLDQDQGDIARRAGVSDPADLRPLQEGLSQRVVPQGDVLDRLARRVERNNLIDRALTGLLEDSRGALEGARDASGRAERGLEQAERAEGGAREAAMREAEASQRQVRDQLGRLISMLDRGQDGYTARREVQRLIEEQRRLIDETQRLGEQTRGQESASLSASQRDQLAQTAGQQQELARRAAQMLADMAQRGLDLQRQDPALAQAMQKSAERGREEEIADNQRRAAEEIRQNRTGSANQSQERALESLQKMMEDLDQTERTRDEALKRVLEDAIQSILALVEAQEAELAALGRALASGALTGLDTGMIRLNADTIGVADKIRSSFRELASVAEIIDAASRAQATAITILRSEAPDGVEADRAERVSLERLRAALEEAERLRREAEEKDLAQKREELRKAYVETLESQVALHAKTAPLAGQALDRRQRAGVRGLSDEQVKIRARLTTLRDENPGLADARLFEYAHERLDQTTGRAAATLAEGNVTVAVDRDQQSAIRVLQSLVEALKDPKKRDFRDSPQDGSQGGQGGQNGEPPLIAPLAELRLLRLMQVEVAELTMDADAARAAGTLEPGSIADVARMQQELTERAEELFEASRPEAPSREEGAGEDNPGASYGAPPRDPPPSPGPPEHPTSPRPPDDEPPRRDPLPSLDDLLGLPEGPETGREGDPGMDAAREELERQLSPAPGGGQAELLNLLRQASQRLRDQLDPGVTTQRAQAEAIRRIEQFIDQQEQNQSQSQRRQRSRQEQQQQQQQQQAQQSQAQQQAAAGENRRMVDPPGREDGSLSPPAPGVGARWGSLPAHVRDALQQGSSDRYSALYRALTEEYYRRLAEQPSSGAPR